MRTAPGDTANSWDEFYAHWVHPVLHFGTPMLIAFAVPVGKPSASNSGPFGAGQK